jgi:class 3 adenylate cyclase
MICPNCRTELPSDARFCMNCGQALQAASPNTQLRLDRMAAAAPATLLEKAREANRLIGERRIVTALFMDVVGSRTLAARLGTETSSELINDAFDLAYPVIYRYEGSIAQLQDDELLAFFGAPVAHEDDPVRAVRAALNILEAVRQYAIQVKVKHGIDFGVRISLSTGPVTLGPVGEALKYEYSALGGTLNLVTQVEAAKLPMTVLMTEYTYRFVAPFFDTTDLGEVTAGNISRPTRIYRVEALSASPGQARGLSGLVSPMVGRQRELASLVQLLNHLQAGIGRSAVILGEPGIGKTRLISEWRSHADENKITWAQGRCLSYGSDQPYHLVLSMLRSLARVPEMADEPETRAGLLALCENLCDSGGPDFMDVYPYLGHLLGLRLDGEAMMRTRQLDPQAHLARAQAALRRMLIALANRSPVVIVLEDLHWADPSSVELISQIIPLVATERLLFCMAMRSEPDAPGWRLVSTARKNLGALLTEITLEALSEADSRQLVANLLAIEALPESVRNLILQKAEGNPFFVEEVIRMLIDRGAILFEDNSWHAGAGIEVVEIPDNLQGLLLARIDRLPEEVKQTLRVAAVIGRQFPVKVLEHVLAREQSR